MYRILFLLVLSFVLTGCFAEPTEVDLNTVTNLPTFWMGLWQGIIAPFSFIVSLFNDNVSIYQSGGKAWYDFGFLIGVSISVGGGGHGTGRFRRKKSSVHVINM